MNLDHATACARKAIRQYTYIVSMSPQDKEDAYQTAILAQLERCDADYWTAKRAVNNWIYQHIFKTARQDKQFTEFQPNDEATTNLPIPICLSKFESSVLLQLCSGNRNGNHIADALDSTRKSINNTRSRIRTKLKKMLQSGSVPECSERAEY